MLGSLDEDCCWHLFQFLRPYDLFALLRVNSHLNTTVESYIESIQQLDFGWEFNVRDRHIIKVVKRFPQLKHLKFRTNDLTDRTLKAIAENPKFLKSLSLNGCPRISDACLAHMLGNCSGLEELYLFDCKKITDNLIVSMTEITHSLKILDLTHCTKIEKITLSGSLKSLKVLRLNNSRIKEIIVCSEDLVELEELDLTRCFGIYITSLFDLSVRLKNLHVLSLNDCRHTTDEVVDRFITTCPKLERLDVRNCQNVSRTCNFIRDIKRRNCDNDGLLNLVYCGCNDCHDLTVRKIEEDLDIRNHTYYRPPILTKGSKKFTSY